jgi:hypothetical protein
MTAQGEALRAAFRARLHDPTGSFAALSPVQLEALRDLLRLALQGA